MTVQSGQAAADADWFPVGEEPLPIGSIAHHVVLRRNGVSVLSLPNGDIDAASEPSAGMYFRDTRYLSRLTVSFGGVPPILLDARETEQGLTAIFTNAGVGTPGGGTIPAQGLVLRRKRVVTDGMLESLTVSNYSREAVDVDLRVAIGVDFRDIFEVRGYTRHGARPEVESTAGSSSVVYRYRGQDGIVRATTITFQQEPFELDADEATFHLRLEPRETTALELEVLAERHHPDYTLARAASRLLEGQRAWLSGLATVETDDDAVTAVLQRAVRDIESLRTITDEDEYIAAGVPWFDTLFGRDSLITGIEMLAFTPEVLRTSLVVLARHQATVVDPVHDAAPGKIPHELRWGELANTGEVPFGQYYGSVDATPLFIIAAHEYVRWTGDYETLRSLWPAIEGAVAWCRDEAARGVDGFLAYARESAAGLENQGWKDSHDAICWPDGRLVEQPIALVEVQAYLAAAWNAYAHMSAMMGQAGAVQAWRAAREFGVRFQERYAHPELGYVLCLDAAGKAVPTPASNAGHVLWAGAARRDLAGRTAERLMQPDLFSGWGVRTLSTTVVGYNPLGYHVGSVWPHDNALFLHGLRWYGLDE
ncbi:MAG: amylo-alpha-1,6-glucosidase, partial [Dehalococcoidia bacterium]|nr:amylo-alpha-1,6-glucosidase [Dehalococcoidia bacterium]